MTKAKGVAKITGIVSMGAAILIYVALSFESFSNTASWNLMFVSGMLFMVGLFLYLNQSKQELNEQKQRLIRYSNIALATVFSLTMAGQVSQMVNVSIGVDSTLAACVFAGMFLLSLGGADAMAKTFNKEKVDKQTYVRYAKFILLPLGIFIVSHLIMSWVLPSTNEGTLITLAAILAGTAFTALVVIKGMRETKASA